MYVHLLSSRGLGVQIVGFLIWSKLHEFSGLSFLICKSRSDRMSSRSLHAQMLYDPVKLWNGRWEVQIPAPLYNFAGSQPFLAYVVNFIVWLEITWLLPSLTNNKHRAFNNFEKPKSTAGDTDIFKGRNPNESHPPTIFNFSSALSSRAVKYFFSENRW